MKHLANTPVLIDGHRIATGAIPAETPRHEPVVLVHGTPSSSIIWRNITPKLTAAGFDVYVFDLLGYGLSERPQDPAIDTSVSAQVPIMEALLDHWGLDSAHIVGHDFGGAIAKRLGLFSPERIRSLTLIDIVSFDSYPSRRTREQMQAGLEKLIKKPDNEHRAHFKDWLLSAVFDKEKLAATALDTYVDFISGPIGQGSLFQHQVRHYDPVHTLEIADRLHELSQHRVQIIWGEDDEWQVIDWAHRLNKAIPGSELHILQECGHFAMEDQPEKISKQILEFLERVQQ